VEKKEGKSGFDEDVNGIFTVENEVQVWSDILNQDSRNPVFIINLWLKLFNCCLFRF
jgi:hypothetical protein